MNQLLMMIPSLLLAVFGDKDARKRISTFFREGFKSKEDLLKEGIDIDGSEKLQ